jgi:hypothetical protein
MYNLKNLVLEYSLPAEEILTTLEIPHWHLTNGLENYQFNEPVREYLRTQIETAVASRPRI